MLMQDIEVVVGKDDNCNKYIMQTKYLHCNERVLIMRRSLTTKSVECNLSSCYISLLKKGSKGKIFCRER